jgi:hypothetical protein
MLKLKEEDQKQQQQQQQEQQQQQQQVICHNRAKQPQKAAHRFELLKLFSFGDR